MEHLNTNEGNLENTELSTEQHSVDNSDRADGITTKEINRPSRIKAFFLAIEKIIVLFLIVVGNTALFNKVLDWLGFNSSGFTTLIVGGLILIYFWKKWNHAWTVIIGGLFAVLTSLVIGGLSPNSLPFPANVFAFQIFFLLLPFILIAPIVGLVALLYASFRGLLAARKNDDQNSNLAENPKTSIFRKIISLILGAILVIIIGYPLFFILHSGKKDVPQSTNHNIGREIIFDLPMAYSQDCTGCGDTGKSKKINRDFDCIEDLDSLGSSMFKGGHRNVSYIPSDMKFKVAEVFDVKKYGIDRIGGDGYTLAVLEDEDGLKSTTLIHSIEDDDGPCINEMTPHIEKLFRHIEKAGTTRIQATLYDLDTDESNKTTQRKFIEAIESLPGKYHPKNTELVKSSIPRMIAVEMDVDPDTLVFLIASSLDLSIWEITGVDDEYLETLTEEDIEGIRTTPLYSNL